MKIKMIESTALTHFLFPKKINIEIKITFTAHSLTFKNILFYPFLDVEQPEWDGYLEDSVNG